MGLALAHAQNWLRKRLPDIAATDRDFIVTSRKVAQRRRRRVQALFGGLGLAIVLLSMAWLNQNYLKGQWREYTIIRPYMRSRVRPYVLSAAAERALKPGASFAECAADCPELVVVPAGEFIMGSAADEPGHNAAEEPQHKVTFAKPFAVGKFELTFAEWDTCAAYGDCNPNISDSSRGRGRQPVINVTWEDAKRYVAWLSRMTGKQYRLLSEAEWEYAARGGTRTAYSWGDDVGKGNASCSSCGSQWDGKQAAPVGSFPPNPFGLYEMEGNVWEWLEDCEHDNYNGAPNDGSAWLAAACKSHVLRGGAYLAKPLVIRTANRTRIATGNRGNAVGFRVARTLLAP